MYDKQRAELLAAQKNANSFCTTEECFIRDMLLKRCMENMEKEAEKAIKNDEKDKKALKIDDKSTEKDDKKDKKYKNPLKSYGTHVFNHG